MKIKYSNQKNFKIQYSGRSTDYISPDFVLNCNYGCATSYCYVQRKFMKFVYVMSNVQDILDKIYEHYQTLPVKSVNQCGNKWSYDISCNSDLGVYGKFIPTQRILDFFNENDIISSFATKRVSKHLLSLKPTKLNRIRFSLMPQSLSDKLEPKTSKIIDRIKAINDFNENGWEVHINFSPIVVYRNWLDDYKKLFELISNIVKYDFKTENIFLTHNEKLHNSREFEFENFLWNNLQENKISSYGSENVRYKHDYKDIFIKEFKEIYSQFFDLQTIRYIF